MRKSRYTDEQIIGFIRQADAGVSVADLCRKEGFSSGSVRELFEDLVSEHDAARMLHQTKYCHWRAMFVFVGRPARLRG